ncbi:MAG: hypothetical protein Q4E88_06000 [Coriobacteriia bacterium]|nr:hypothetical protein [Coriobacteriia bacterium]
MTKKILTAVIVIALAVVFLGCSNKNKIKITSLKGPTSVGISEIIADKNYETNIVAQADVAVSDLVSGKTDIALIPSNLALNIYNKNKSIKVIDINTLGVLCAVSQNATSLEGHKIYMTGKGTIPEILVRKCTDNTDIEFKNEAAEVVSFISKDPDAVGIINEPQATIAVNKNPKLKKFSSPLEDTITGVTVVNKDFQKDKIDQFIKDHRESVAAVQDNPRLAIESGIFENTDFIEEAIKNCNICCITGSEMKDKLSNFYTKIDMQAPDDDFYYEG